MKSPALLSEQMMPVRLGSGLPRAFDVFASLIWTGPIAAAGCCSLPWWSCLLPGERALQTEASWTERPNLHHIQTAHNARLIGGPEVTSPGTIELLGRPFPAPRPSSMNCRLCLMC